VAHPNIALAKYWGKRDGEGNVPSVPSLSLTLAGMTTRTSVCFDAARTQDVLTLDGEVAQPAALQRVSDLLDALWEQSRVSTLDGVRPRAAIDSLNDFPTASGLASSASAFAALAVAANEAAGAGLRTDELSDLAGGISASAARSLYGGLVALPAGDGIAARGDGSGALAARPVAGPDHWSLRVIVAVTDEAPKKVGSTEGMLHTAATSPLYAAWLDVAPGLYEAVRAAVLARDFDALVPPVEQSALVMHATSIAAQPGIVYWNGGSLAAMSCVRRLRGEGVPVCFTIDAGPHVKALTLEAHADAVEAELRRVPGVLRTIAARPGDGARLVTDPT
jgi:diphosphomevalonate decarboxylase